MKENEKLDFCSTYDDDCRHGGPFAYQNSGMPASRVESRFYVQKHHIFEELCYQRLQYKVFSFCSALIPLIAVARSADLFQEEPTDTVTKTELHQEIDLIFHE